MAIEALFDGLSPITHHAMCGCKGKATFLSVEVMGKSSPGRQPRLNTTWGQLEISRVYLYLELANASDRVWIGCRLFRVGMLVPTKCLAHRVK